jgi:hypothetical protein
VRLSAAEDRGEAAMQVFMMPGVEQWRRMQGEHFKETMLKLLDQVWSTHRGEPGAKRVSIITCEKAYCQSVRVRYTVKQARQSFGHWLAHVQSRSSGGEVGTVDELDVQQYSLNFNF